MGSSLNSDPKVRVYLTLKNRMNYAGKIVEGAVHINCYEDRPYRFLHLRIKGKERIMWAQNYNGKTTVVYSNSKQTYYAEVMLADFGAGIPRGQYSFPFSFLLPASMPASFELNITNYIEYKLEACVLKFDNSTSDQIFKVKLHVRQPPRGMLRQIKGEYASQSKCCKCCCSCGMTELAIQSNVKYLEHNQSFQVKGRVETGLSKVKINNYKVVLRQKFQRISNVGREQKWKNDYVLYDAMTNVPERSSDTFSCSVKIPPQAEGYTAIGVILSRAYFLTLVAEVCCCLSNPRLELHTIYISKKEPEIDKNQRVEPPNDWNPLIAEPKVFNTLPPYLYIPSKNIEIWNQEEGYAINHMKEMEMSVRNLYYDDEQEDGEK